MTGGYNPRPFAAGKLLGAAVLILVALVVIWIAGGEDEAVYSAPPEQVTVDLSS